MPGGGCQKIGHENLLYPHEHAALVHPRSLLACIDGRWVEGGEFFFRDAPIRLTFKNDHRRQKISGSRHGKCRRRSFRPIGCLPHIYGLYTMLP